MSDEDDSASIWIRRGHYAIGRDGYSPFIALPPEKAEKAASRTTMAGRISFVVLLLSGVVIGAQALGAPIPIAVDGLLFVLELSLVALASSVIAKTVIQRKKTETSNSTKVDIEGISPGSLRQNALQIKAWVDESRFNISVSHRRTGTVDIRLIDAWSDSGNFQLRDLNGLAEGISIEPTFNTADNGPPSLAESTAEFEFEVIRVNSKEYLSEDTLHAVLGMKNRSATQEREEQLSIPISVSPTGQVESEETVEVTFERLTE